MDARTMRPEFVDVPSDPRELVRRVRIAGFTLTEARHASLRRISRHAHERSTITFLLDGVFDELYARRTESCAAESVLFRPAEEPHEDRFGRVGGVNLVLEVDGARESSIGPARQLLSERRQMRDPRLTAIAHQIRGEMRQRDGARDLTLEGLILEFLGTAARTGAVSHLRPPPPWLRRVREAIHDGFAENVRMEELARVADVHPVYLARAFRACFGVSPGEYLRRRRIEWAIVRLRDARATLKDVAVEAGFADQSHFARTFRRIVGRPPSEFVRLLRGRS